MFFFTSTDPQNIMSESEFFQIENICFNICKSHMRAKQLSEFFSAGLCYTTFPTVHRGKQQWMSNFVTSDSGPYHTFILMQL